jgi:hypothetical protein
MREAMMSPELFVAHTAAHTVEHTVAQRRTRPEVVHLKQTGGWDPEDFAREQIRGLVRQVFLSSAGRPARQVVFSAAEPETDVQNLCRSVGEALAQETAEEIALVGAYPQVLTDAKTLEEAIDRQSTREGQAATRVGDNLWLVPPAWNHGALLNTASLQSCLDGLRTQFAYSIVAGPPASESNAATAMAQLADGIVLVLSAQHTRRITARKIKEKLEAAQARLLGTVLSDRVFPIPERIYRRL